MSRGASASKAWWGCFGPWPSWNPRYLLLDCEGPERLRHLAPLQCPAAGLYRLTDASRQREVLGCSVKPPHGSGSGPKRLLVLQLPHGLRSKATTNPQAGRPPPPRRFRGETASGKQH